MSGPEKQEEKQLGNEAATPGTPDIFGTKPPEASRRSFLLAMLVAGVVLVAAVLLVMRHERSGLKPAGTLLPLDPYAAKLVLSDQVMSQSTSLSGGTSTFLDGHMHNTGDQTLTGVTLQVLFRNDEGLTPAVETVPLSLIRTHEPYVDTEPVSAAPLKPGDNVEFRLIFERIPENWNQQMPEIHVVGVVAR